jgi:hypothetical protein
LDEAEKALAEERNVLTSQRKAWDDHKMILCNQVEDGERALQTSHRNESALDSKLAGAQKALFDLQQTSSHDERALVDKLNDERNVFNSQQKAWDDRKRILCNQVEDGERALQTSHRNESALDSKLAEAQMALFDLQQTSSHNKRTLDEKLEETGNSLIKLQEQMNKITPATEEIHALLARIDSVADGVDDVENVISGTKKWLDQQPAPDQGVSVSYRLLTCLF